MSAWLIAKSHQQNSRWKKEKREERVNRSTLSPVSSRKPRQQALSTRLVGTKLGASACICGPTAAPDQCPALLMPRKVENEQIKDGWAQGMGPT
jgi:hypothetical protein